MFWLVLGMFQLLLTGSACSNAADDHLFSSEDPLQTSSAAKVPTPSAHTETPLRISRAFFEKSVVGSLTVADQMQQQTLVHVHVNDSNVLWQEYPTTIPPSPRTDLIADFREHQGCAIYENIDGLKLCFNVVPDVSSLAVNAKEVKVEGISRVIEPIANCAMTLHFTGASKTGDIVSISFVAKPSAEAANNPDCQNHNLNVDLTLRQL